MEIFLIVLASILTLAGWILSLAGISGTWVILIAAVGLDVFYDWSWDFIVTSIIFLLLCVLAEVVEFVSGLLGAKALGGSRASQVGAFVGTLAGGLLLSFAIPIPIVGTIIGVVVGGFVGALLGELRHQQKTREAGTKGAGMKVGLKAGVGAMIARILAIVVKAAISTIMVAWFIWVAIHNAA